MLLRTAASALFLVSSALAADPDALALTPKDAEVVISVNARQVVDSTYVQKILEAKGDQAKAVLGIVQNMSGTDITKDLDRITFYGRVNDEESVGVFIDGRFQEEKLVLLLQANPQYKKSSVGTMTVHEWFDDGEQASRLGAFLSPGRIGIWNSKASMEASMAAMGDKAKSLAGTPDAAAVPAGAADAAAWAMLITRQDTCPGAKLKVATASALVRIDKNDLVAEATVTANSDDAGRQWIDLAKGALALAQLQPESQELKDLAARSTVEAKGPRTVSVQVRLDNETILDRIEEAVANE